ncbi:hypothetical protein [Bradyrhizobium roseum]|uniref:hypothetical protein n=1 Tax=Bradyrhizobium roseum TaxID=3056648 RepID=UPI00260CD9BE|nr:hypothetical protein [Bradyrhizobium roseus]WKA31702.1 hypothetical protein QUH67_16760 [Bradyrhizobium roseus]
MTTTIRVLIVRWVDDEPQPGIVECKLTDRFGRDWSFMEKCAVISPGGLCNDSTYPQSGAIGCHIVFTGLDDNGREFAVVDTEQPWGINAVNGDTRFEVFADQIDRS